MASLFPETRSNSRSGVDTARTQVAPSSPTRVDRVGTTAKHLSISSPEEAYPADGRCGRARTLVVPEENKQAGQNQNELLGGYATGADDGQSHPIASKRMSWVANPNHDGHILQMASGSARVENGLIDQHPRDKHSIEAGRSSKKDRLEEENARFVKKFHVNFVFITFGILEPL